MDLNELADLSEEFIALRNAFLKKYHRHFYKDFMGEVVIAPLQTSIGQKILEYFATPSNLKIVIISKIHTLRMKILETVSTLLTFGIMIGIETALIFPYPIRFPWKTSFSMLDIIV